MAIRLNEEKTQELEKNGCVQVDDSTFVIKKDDYYYITKMVEFEELYLNCKED